MPHSTSSFARHRAVTPTIKLPTGSQPVVAPQRRTLGRVLAVLGAALASHGSRHQRPYLS